MNGDSADVTGLVPEYETLVGDSLATNHEGGRRLNTDKLQQALVYDAGWTAEGGDALFQLARDYGSFMLRNALALSLALKIEDGELGF